MGAGLFTSLLQPTIVEEDDRRLRTCKVCGVKYKRVKGVSFVKFCSLECQDSGNAETMRGSSRRSVRARRAVRPPKTCCVCGVFYSFIGRGKSICCSAECSRKARTNKSREHAKKAQQAAERVTKLCVICRGAFSATAASGRLCCSANCSEERTKQRYRARDKTRNWAAISREQREKHHDRYALACLDCATSFSSAHPRKYCTACLLSRNSRRATPSSLSPRSVVLCFVCGKEHERRGRNANVRALCSDKCRQRLAAIGSKLAPISCKHCALEFCRLPGGSYGKYCSADCHAAKQRAVSARRRAKRMGSKERFRIRLFNYYEWRCQACHCATPDTLLGTTLPDAPTIDHKTPVSRGGDDSWENLWLLCWFCNLEKGSKPAEQYMSSKALA